MGSSENLVLSASVQDNVATGTEQILDSPHVSEGPGRVANAPVPSVFFDDRGEIHRLRVGGIRLNLLYSKKSVMRSGYLHPNRMYDFVISGKVEVWTLGASATIKKIYVAGDKFLIQPYVPHILHFLEDSVILEWWEGAFKCWYYHPYRRLMEVQNSLVCKNTGILHPLVPQDNAENQQSSSSTSILTKFFWLTTGIITGVVIGSLLQDEGGARHHDRRS